MKSATIFKPDKLGNYPVMLLTTVPFAHKKRGDENMFIASLL